MKNSVITDASALFGKAAKELHEAHPELTVVTLNLGINNFGGYCDTDSVAPKKRTVMDTTTDFADFYKESLNQKYGKIPRTEQFLQEIKNAVVDYLGEEYESTCEEALNQAVEKLKQRISRLFIVDDVLATELVSHVAFFHVLDHTQLSCVLREIFLKNLDVMGYNPYRGLWYGRYCNNKQEHSPELVHPAQEYPEYEMDDEPDEEERRWLYAQARDDGDENSTQNNTPWLYI